MFEGDDVPADVNTEAANRTKKVSRATLLLCMN